jgi:hypothetical protein
MISSSLNRMAAIVCPDAAAARSDAELEGRAARTGAIMAR